nr:helix-turn-helix transcriptional regulator [uncultured Dysosmobacter sp.]
MHKAKTADGRANICGRNIRRMRKELRPKCSQAGFAGRLQLLGLDVDKNAVQRMECGKRTVSDIELKVIAQALGVTADELLREP